MNNIQDFIQKNTWNLIITFVAIIFSWATLNGRVMAIETNHKNLEVKLERITDLAERIIVLEEHDKELQTDITEIKQDVKDLKNYFNIR